MESRKHISTKLRTTLSKLHQLINQRKFIRGTLYYLRNTCGKSYCKCARGERHISLYIQQTKNRKVKKVLIPKSRHKDVEEMNKRYREILKLLEEVSDYEWEHLKEKN